VLLCGTMMYVSAIHQMQMNIVGVLHAAN